MQLHDGSILIHETVPYDPAKAHEYYLRTRQLKGRKGGQSTSDSTFSVKLDSGQTFKLTGQQLAEQRAYANERVGKITKRLNELASKLRKAISEAKNKKEKAKIEAARPTTAAEKSQAARDSKQYRETHKQSLATKRKIATTKEKVKSDPVANLEKKINKIQDSLSAAVAKQRALAGATKIK